MNNKWVWTNQYLPQTLAIAVMIGYFRAFFACFGIIAPLIFGQYTSFGWMLVILGVLGSFGIANIRLWGYYLACVVSVLSLITANGRITRQYPLDVYFNYIFSQNNLLNLMFQVAMICLLLHPMSRNFAKKNFKKSIP